MGYPSEGTEGLYRNAIKDVERFFNERHKNKYRIYNLCTERKYNHKYFKTGTICEDYDFDDHNPPPFEYILNFCKDCY